MTEKESRTIVCPHCGEEYEVECYTSVMVFDQNDPIKLGMIDSSIYEHECPRCHNKNILCTPAFYQDFQHGLMVNQGSFPTLMLQFQIHETAQMIKKVSDNLFKVPGVIELGCINASDFASKITMLDNGLDYRIGTIYEATVRHHFDIACQADENNVVKIYDSYFGYDDDGELCVYLILEEEGKEERLKLPIKFDRAYYDRIEKECLPYIDDVYTHVFDIDAAKKFIYMRTRKDIDKLKSHIVKFIAITNDEGQELLVYVRDHDLRTYCENQEIKIKRGSREARGKVTGIIEMSEFASPFYLSELWMADGDDLEIKEEGRLA